MTVGDASRGQGACREADGSTDGVWKAECLSRRRLVGEGCDKLSWASRSRRGWRRLRWAKRPRVVKKKNKGSAARRPREEGERSARKPSGGRRGEAERSAKGRTRAERAG